MSDDATTSTSFSREDRHERAGVGVEALTSAPHRTPFAFSRSWGRAEVVSQALPLRTCLARQCILALVAAAFVCCYLEYPRIQGDVHQSRRAIARQLPSRQVPQIVNDRFEAEGIEF